MTVNDNQHDDVKLVRRTGKHPLNAETPSQVLLEHDVTPVEYFYVRCHGVEPDLNETTHTIDLYDGDRLIHRLKVQDLKTEFDRKEILVTMVCDGNRRKELNVIKRSRGFDWGCCAVSTGRFEGVLLRDILRRFYDEHQLHANKYVVFESADELKEGHYGTSLSLAGALQDSSDVLLAYGMNGEALRKEHGYPVRTILPGCVGGRTVKWLSKITLSETDSDNHYHLKDNSVFPTNVTNGPLMSQYITEQNKVYERQHSKNHKQDSGPAENKENHAIGNSRHPGVIFEMNLNSAILTPTNGHRIRITDNVMKEIEFAGYAYDGGGRKVIRVELTLDDGETWISCDTQYPSGYHPENGTRWYVLCKWRTTVPVWKLGSSKSVSVRAWNQSMNTQPEKHTWNLLGMMNNAWYTLRLERQCAETLRILHPVSSQPSEPKGWMERLHPLARYEEKKIPPVTFTREDVSQHKSVSDCWVIIDNKVYDLTDFLNLHPGGQASILAHAGDDVTTLFYDIHSEDTHVLKSSYIIGSISGREEDESKNRPSPHKSHPFLERKHPRVTPTGNEIALSSFKWTDVTLKSKVPITHDTRRFTFALPKKDQRMWLPWGKHINLGVDLPDRMVVRAYTPVKPVLAEEDDGTFELVIKTYFPTEDRPGGEMTMILEKLQPGDTVKMKGPEGVLWYLGTGRMAVHGHFFYCAKMNFIVGGTGITPALAVMKAVVLAEKRRDVGIRLVFANKTTQDILCKDELDQLVTASDNFQICHVISDGNVSSCGDLSPSDKVAFDTGHVNVEILKAHIFPADEGVSCFLCGPPAMIAKGVIPALMELGFDDEQMLEF
ncbi:hypothetical protein BC832DRAFT_567613 [Gaertneriomyces semiglobifer]|nr:hypothetical protein BC832DRAFT_567613 [Gaertneriomyces semiglobifer]